MYLNNKNYNKTLKIVINKKAQNNFATDYKFMDTSILFSITHKIDWFVHSNWALKSQSTSKGTRLLKLKKKKNLRISFRKSLLEPHWRTDTIHFESPHVVANTAKASLHFISNANATGFTDASEKDRSLSTLPHRHAF